MIEIWTMRPLGSFEAVTVSLYVLSLIPTESIECLA